MIPEGFANSSAVSAANPELARGWRFDGFEFDCLRGEFRAPDGATIALRPKVETLLRLFLQRPGQLLPREELMSAIWPTAVVTDDSLAQCVRELRAALGNRASTLIRTVPRRGYRFEGVVEALAEPVKALASQPISTATTAASSPLTGLAPPRPRRRRAWVATTLLAAAFIIALAFRFAPRTNEGVSSLDAQFLARHVIAVMPFQSESPELRTTAQELAEAVTSQLSAFPGTRSIGPARTATIGDAARDRLSRELGATYLITGHVAKLPEAPTMSVEIQLVALPAGDLIGASQRFDLGRGPAARTSLGIQVANFLRGRVAELDVANALRPGHVADPVDLTMLGWNEVMSRRGDAEALARTRQRFESALRDDPNSVIALGGLGAVYLQQRFARAPLDAAQAAGGEQAIDRALQLAPRDAIASLNWGNLQLLEGRPELAVAALEKATRLAPGVHNSHLVLARALLESGRLDEAGPEAQRAASLAQLSGDEMRASWAFQLAAEAALMRHEDELALTLVRRAVGAHPRSGEAYAVLAAINALLGRSDEAAAEITVAHRLNPQMTIANFDAMRPASEARYLAARARLYDGLRQAGLGER